MCGIVGVIPKHNSNIEKNDLIAFRDSLTHRGPDGAGVYIDDYIGLGHRRLAILDTSDRGVQPMKSDDDRYYITFNGEIFNFIELREELKSLGYVFHTETDTEVILHSYKEWGETCLDKLNGMFAFAIYDTKNTSVFLARDRFGIKPLYYANTKEMFAFASEPLAFSNLEGFNFEISKDNVAATLQNTFALESKGNTLYKDIYQLRPGHTLTITKNGVGAQIRWWYPENQKIDIPDSYEDQVKEFKRLFFDACKIRLRSDVRIASALSGGVDSSSVYSTVHELMKKSDVERIPDDWQTACIGSFPGSDLDELELARSVVDNVKGTAKEVLITPEKMITSIIKDTKAYGVIHVSPLSVISQIYKGMKEEGITVSLDGHGVDEMMYGYPDLVAEAYVSACLKKDKKHAEELSEVYVNMFDPKDKEKMKEVLKNRSSFVNLCKKRIKKYIPKSVLKTKNQHPWIKHNAHVPDELGSDVVNTKKGSEAVLFENFYVTVLPTLLRNFDRVSMQHGIEIRMPFMDWRLVTYVFSLQQKSKLGVEYTKRILRDAMKDVLPESIRTRSRKIGINAPLHEWFGGELKEYLDEITHSESFLHSDIWDGPAIAKFVEERKDVDVWSWDDAIKVWPFINAHILVNT